MPKKQETNGLDGLLHHAVEVRTSGGGSVRGELRALDAGYLYLARRAGGDAIIPRAAISYVLDEERLATNRLTLGHVPPRPAEPEDED